MDPLFLDAKRLIVSLWKTQPDFKEWLDILCKNVQEDKNGIPVLNYIDSNQQHSTRKTLMLAFHQNYHPKILTTETSFSSDVYLHGNTWFTTFWDEEPSYFSCHCMNPLLLNKTHENIRMNSGSRGLDLRKNEVAEVLYNRLSTEKKSKGHLTCTPISTVDVEEYIGKHDPVYIQWLYVVQVSSLVKFYNKMTSNQ